MEGERSAPDMHRWYSVLNQVNVKLVHGKGT